MPNRCRHHSSIVIVSKIDDFDENQRSNSNNHNIELSRIQILDQPNIYHEMFLQLKSLFIVHVKEISCVKSTPPFSKTFHLCLIAKDQSFYTRFRLIYEVRCRNLVNDERSCWVRSHLSVCQRFVILFI